MLKKVHLENTNHPASTLGISPVTPFPMVKTMGCPTSVESFGSNSHTVVPIPTEMTLWGTEKILRLEILDWFCIPTSGLYQVLRSSAVPGTRQTGKSHAVSGRRGINIGTTRKDQEDRTTGLTTGWHFSHGRESHVKRVSLSVWPSPTHHFCYPSRKPRFVFRDFSGKR
jgi:hypothetical protein